jgi:hypothetical protein
MSDTPDPLETELAALRPRPVSPDLRRRVADRLSAPVTHRRWAWGLALAGVLTAAGLIALFAPGPKPPPLPVPPAVVPALPAPAESTDPSPSVLVYHQALARSPDDLDALLDRQAATAPNPNVLAVGTFTRSPATLDALLGDD